jgi:broad specificity phosphatase PhoE
MPRIVVNTRRHADRKDTTKTGLTREGINQSRQFGKGIKNPKTKIYFGKAQRTRSTAKIISQNAGNLSYVPRERVELTTSAVDKKKWLQFVKKYGDKEKATRAWLNGEIPSNVVVPPKIVADRIIKKRLKLAWRLLLSGRDKIVIEQISHQENQPAVMERLLGFSSEKLLNGKPIKPLESVQIIFSGGKIPKIELVFRRKKFNVTERFEKILSLKHEGQDINLTK